MPLAGQTDLFRTSIVTPVFFTRSTAAQSRPQRAGIARPARRRHAALVRTVAVVAVFLPLAVVGRSAAAAPTPSISQLRARIEALQQQAEQATERFNGTREQITSVRIRAAAAHARLAQQTAQVAAARRALGQIAAERYRQGPLGALQVLFSDDAANLLAQSGLATTFADREAAAIQRLESARRQLNADNADVTRQQVRLSKARADLKAQQKAVLSKIAAAKAQLARLSATQLAALQRASRNGVRAGMTCAQVAVVAPTARVGRVLAYACSHLGDAYLFGAEGPYRFDCSGFTLRSWEQGGVTLPRTAGEQANVGTRISASQLRPGDLVFYYSPISHVGIVLGNGLMIHAPHTGAFVEIAAIRYAQMTAAVRL